MLLPEPDGPATAIWAPWCTVQSLGCERDDRLRAVAVDDSGRVAFDERRLAHVTTRPSASSTLRCAASARRRLWVAATTAQPAPARCRSSETIRSAVSESSSPVGSSASRSGGIVRQGHGEPGAGELRRPRAAPAERGRRAQADTLQDRTGGGDVGVAAELLCEQDIALDAEVAEQVAALEEHPDRTSADRRAHRLGSPRHALAGDVDDAAVGLVEPREARQQRRLPRAGRPDDGDDLAGLGRQRHAAQRERLLVTRVVEAVELAGLEDCASSPPERRRDGPPGVDVVGPVRCLQRHDGQAAGLPELVPLDIVGHGAARDRIARAARLVADRAPPGPRVV